jgi:hypothetical protein
MAVATSVCLASSMLEPHSMARGPFRFLATLVALTFVAGSSLPRAAYANDLAHRPAPTGDISGTITDSSSSAPLEGVTVTVLRGTSVVSLVTTDAFGRFRLHNLTAGAYTITTRMLGFRPAGMQITVGDGKTVQANFQLVVTTTQLQTVTLQAGLHLAVVM